MDSQNDNNNFSTIDIKDFLSKSPDKQLEFIHSLSKKEQLILEHQLPRDVEGKLISLEIERAIKENKYVTKNVVSVQSQPEKQVHFLKNELNGKQVKQNNIHIDDHNKNQSKRDDINIDDHNLKLGKRNDINITDHIKINKDKTKIKVKTLKIRKVRTRKKFKDFREFIHKIRWLWPVLVLIAAVLGVGSVYIAPLFLPKGFTWIESIILSIAGFITAMIWIWMIGD